MSVKEKLASYFCCCCSTESTKSANDEFKSSLAVASAVKETEETVDAHCSEAHRPSDQWLQDLLANHNGKIITCLVTNPIYSVDFSQSRISVEKCVFKNLNNGLLQLFRLCPGRDLLAYRVPWHTLQCPCFSIVPEATYEESPRQRRGSCWEERKRMMSFPD